MRHSLLGETPQTVYHRISAAWNLLQQFLKPRENEGAKEEKIITMIIIVIIIIVSFLT